AGGCTVADVSYATTPWPGPYRECRDSVGGRLRNAAFDTDSLLIESHESWIVSPREHRTAFENEEMRIAKLLGPGFRCSPTRVVWHSADSVRVSLTVQVNTDVDPENASDSVSSTISREASLGPLFSAVWCWAPGAPAPCSVAG